MQYLLDLGFLAVFALTIFVSAKRGFFATLIDLAAYVVAFVAAKLFSQQLAPVIFQSSFEAPRSASRITLPRSKPRSARCRNPFPG